MIDLIQKGVPAPPRGRDKGELYSLRPAPRPGAAPQPAASRGEDSADRLILQLDARFDSGGVWAGVDHLIESAYLELLEIGRDDIVEAHNHELYQVLLRHRSKIRRKYLSLTETASDGERTRFLGFDHAYGIVNGLVGFVQEWKRVLPRNGRCLIVVRNFDQAQHMVRRFFAELARRTVVPGAFEILIETHLDVQAADLEHRAVEAVPAAASLTKLVTDLPPPRAIPSAEVKTLEQRIDDGDELLLEMHYPALLAHYRARDDGLAAARVALKVLKIYNRDAYYFESKTFLDIFLPYFDELVGQQDSKRISAVSEINKCLVATDEPDRVLRIITERAAPYVTDPAQLATMNYMLSMLYLRYAEAIDLERAEQHILRAVDCVRGAKDRLSSHDFLFRTVFMNNGLALLRVRQGRHQEALDLCQSGYASLTAELGEDCHLLHRSVLIYNIGQVYVAIGRLEEGLDYYRRAIKMDPYYTEYYNACGNILQKLERYQEAVEYYALWIRYGTPNPVLYFNKGVCHTRQGEAEEALPCFDASLELEPNQPEIHAMRGELLAGLGRADEALEDYNCAIALAPDTIATRVNRAVLHYTNASYELALSDMDHVIALEPQEPGHYENRAAIYQALQCDDQYERDLGAAERCRAAE